MKVGFRQQDLYLQVNLQEEVLGIVVNECPMMKCVSPPKPIDWMTSGRIITNVDGSELTNSATVFY